LNVRPLRYLWVVGLQAEQRSRSNGTEPAARPPAPAPVPQTLAHETGYLLRRAYVHAGTWAATAMPDGVPVRHYEVLQALADLGPRSQHQLSEILWVNRTIMVKLIDTLERDGLVERCRNPDDRRSYALHLTPTGERARTELSHAADRAEAGLTSTLTAHEHVTLSTLLSTIALAGEPPPELPAGLARRVCLLLTPAHHRVRERVNERLHALGLTTALYGVLATIDARGPSSQQAIADQLGLTGPAILQTVDRLEAHGLLDRHRNPTDRRAYALKPTDQGHATLLQARAAIAQINHELDQTLGGQQRRQELNQLLRNVLETE